MNEFLSFFPIYEDMNLKTFLVYIAQLYLFPSLVRIQIVNTQDVYIDINTFYLYPEKAIKCF